MTLDAMGCQKSVAQAIVRQKADYVLALKGNHPTLHENMRLWLDDCDAQGYVHQHQTQQKDHGRIGAWR